MTERWRERLSQLDNPEPSPDVWRRAMIRSTETLPDLPHAGGHRLVAVIVAVALAATGVLGLSIAFGRGPHIGMGGTSPPPTAGGFVTYSDPTGAWEITFPKSFHAEPMLPEDRLAAHGVWIANLPAPAGGDRGARLPDGAIVILITYGTTVSEHVPHLVSSEDSTFPVRSSDLRLAPGAGNIQGMTVIANGQPYVVSVDLGQGADPRTIDRIIGSLHFLPLTRGSFVTGYPTFRVLGMAGEYPIGRVTTFKHTTLEPPMSHGPATTFFSLVHTRHGFYALGWMRGLVSGYRNCDVTFDASTDQFTCPNGARWTIDGSVVATPSPGEAGEPLLTLLTRTSLDGHIMVSRLEVPQRMDLRLTRGA